MLAPQFFYSLLGGILEAGAVRATPLPEAGLLLETREALAS